MHERAATNQERPQCVWKQASSSLKSRVTATRKKLLDSAESPTSYSLDETTCVAFVLSAHRLRHGGYRNGVIVSTRLQGVKESNVKMDVADAQQKMFTLLIKTPNQAQEDQTVEGVYPNWTVKDLKTHLATVYTTKPVSY